MLRASSHHTGRPANLHSLTSAAVDPLVPAGRELLAFADAAVLRDTHEMAAARDALRRTAGDAAVIRAAALAANFQMMNRLLDTIGVRVRRAGLDLAHELGLAVPPHLLPR